MAFAASAAQLVSAPLFRCCASGRLGLNCSLAGSKLAHCQIKTPDPKKTGPGVFYLVAGAGFVLFRQSLSDYASNSTAPHPHGQDY